MYPEFYFGASWAGKLINIITPTYKILKKLKKKNQSKAQKYLMLE